MRGVQLTDLRGAATFRTIYPAWYVGRCTHIRIKVHCGGVLDDGTYHGGTEEHTGQLYFRDEISDEVAQLEPYARRLDVYRTRNEEDSVLNLAGIDNPAIYIKLIRKDETNLSRGFTGTSILGVVPSNRKPLN